MEFTFYTPVLWDFLGDSDDGGIDVRSENCFEHQRDSGRDGQPKGDATNRFPLYYVNVINYLKILPSSYLY